MESRTRPLSRVRLERKKNKGQGESINGQEDDQADGTDEDGGGYAVDTNARDVSA